jgi:uncharacterized protein with HEPN domain
VPPTLGDRLEHILDCIALVEGLFARITEKQFLADPLLRAAVERWLEIISEASRSVPEVMKEHEPTIAWRRMADLGNFLRHADPDVDPIILWDIGRNDLGPLKSFVERVMREERQR